MREKLNEFLKLAGFYLYARQTAHFDSDLPFGFDVAGCMLGMRDSEQEMKLIIEEIKDECQRLLTSR